MLPFVLFMQDLFSIWQLPKPSTLVTMLPFVLFIQYLFSIWQLPETSCWFVIVILCFLMQLTDYIAFRSIYAAFHFDLVTSRTFLLICYYYYLLSNATNWLYCLSFYLYSIYFRSGNFQKLPVDMLWSSKG